MRDDSVAFIVFAFAVIVLVGLFIAGITTGVTEHSKALERQCINTANTLKVEDYIYDRSTQKCNIVTKDGKLVSF